MIDKEIKIGKSGKSGWSYNQRFKEKTRLIQNKSKWIIFSYTKFYPEVEGEFNNIKEAEKKFQKLSNYFAGDNSIWYLCKVLKEKDNSKEEKPIFWGEEGTGKTSN